MKSNADSYRTRIISVFFFFFCCKFTHLQVQGGDLDWKFKTWHDCGTNSRTCLPVMSLSIFASFPFRTLSLHCLFVSTSLFGCNTPGTTASLYTCTYKCTNDHHGACVNILCTQWKIHKGFANLQMRTCKDVHSMLHPDAQLGHVIDDDRFLYITED